MLGTEVIRFAHNEDIFVQFVVFEKHLPVFILMVETVIIYFERKLNEF